VHSFSWVSFCNLPHIVNHKGEGSDIRLAHTYSKLRDLPLDILVLGLDLQPEFNVPRGVLVSVVNDRLVRQLPQVGQGRVHFFWGTFEEPSTTSLKEGVSVITWQES
jgi:hypothetical protein